MGKFVTGVFENVAEGQIVDKYAVMFEEEYRKAAAAKTKYCALFNDVDLESDATEVHDGYFFHRQERNVDGDRREQLG